MKKFQTHHQALEVMMVPSRMPAYLNRQIITLLAEPCSNVPDNVFIKLQVSS
jgi:hypothetical protein